jgi:hypothetical protein
MGLTAMGPISLRGTIPSFGPYSYHGHGPAASDGYDNFDIGSSVAPESLHTLRE